MDTGEIDETDNVLLCVHFRDCFCDNNGWSADFDRIRRHTPLSTMDCIRWGWTTLSLTGFSPQSFRVLPFDKFHKLTLEKEMKRNIRQCNSEMILRSISSLFKYASSNDNNTVSTVDLCGLISFVIVVEGRVLLWQAWCFNNLHHYQRQISY